MDTRAARAIGSLGAMAGLARLVIRLRWLVVGVWIVLTFVGMFSAAKLSDRWFQSFSIPGYSAYEANQRTLKTFGSGEQVAARRRAHRAGRRHHDRSPGIEQAIDGGGARSSRGSRVGSWFDTQSDMYLSKDRHTMVATIYPPGNATFTSLPPIEQARAALKAATPAGRDEPPDGTRSRSSSRRAATTGPGVLTETLLGAARRAPHPPLRLRHAAGDRRCRCAMAAASILTTFLCVYALTYVTDVSIIVQFLVALVGLGVAIDYALAHDLPLPRGARARDDRPTTRSSRR